MRIFDLYLGKSIVAGTLLALLLLVSVSTLMEFVDEIDRVGKQGYTYLAAVIFTFLKVPQSVYEFFPTSMLLGSLLSMGNLAANNELVVMRAAGISIARIIRSTLKSGFIMTVLIMLIGEFVVPMSGQKAQNLRNVSASNRIALSTRDGLWVKDGDRFVNVKEVFPDMRLIGIRVYQFNREGRLAKFTTASSGEYIDDEWSLKNVVTRFISPKKITTNILNEEKWDRLLSPDLFDVITVRPKQMSAMKLARYVDYLNQNGLDSSRYELAFWVRFTIPLSGLVMLLLAMPFVFGYQRSSGAGQRLFIGILIGVAFHLINQTINKLGLVYGISPFTAAIFPLFLFLSISIFAIRRIK